MYIYNDLFYIYIKRSTLHASNLVLLEFANAAGCVE